MNQNSNTPLIIGGAVALFLALAVCGAGGVVFAGALFASSAASSPTSTPAPCATELQKPSVDLYVCSFSENTKNVALVDDVGNPITTLYPSTRVVRLYGATGQPEEIRRQPGRIDVRVCVLGSGKVGYVRNTYISGGPCK